MIKYILVIWLGSFDDATVHSIFDTQPECEQRKQELLNVLSPTQVQAACRIRYTVGEYQ